MKVFALAPNEDWICDRFVDEFNAHNEVAHRPDDADLVWLLADWCWQRVNTGILTKKKVIATVHHLVPGKFKENDLRMFMYRDQFVDAYHVPCNNTKKQIQEFTDKPIYSFPFWVNQGIWNRVETKEELREKYGISKDAFLIGSFQRDTEGHDLKSPKLEKGPDIFCDFVETRARAMDNVEVLLGSWRRQYVMGRLDAAGIKYHFHKLPPLETINEFYSMLDLYFVGSRHEGGPQAVFECAATKTPILSSNAGYAPELLHDDSLVEKSSSIEAAMSDKVLDYNFDKVSKFFMPNGFENFRKMFEEVL
jgi:glycosyltransferase involved in cell wall biosynthesis